jgi:hypothetical protein
LAVGFVWSGGCFAQPSDTDKLPTEIAQTVPVYEGSVDRPFIVVGEIRDNLRKHFAFQANPTKEKIFEELWERGRKLNADAVINAKFGATKGTPFNHGRTPISGTAIKYTDGPKPQE